MTQNSSPPLGSPMKHGASASRPSSTPSCATMGPSELSAVHIGTSTTTAFIAARAAAQSYSARRRNLTRAQVGPVSMSQQWPRTSNSVRTTACGCAGPRWSAAAAGVTWATSSTMGRLQRASATASTRVRWTSTLPIGDRGRPVSESGQPPAQRRETSAVAGGGRSALPLDASRASMMRRQAALPLAARIALFEALSADAAWARAAVRVR
jgi:hypothetical protein